MFSPHVFETAPARWCARDLERRREVPDRPTCRLESKRGLQDVRRDARRLTPGTALALDPFARAGYGEGVLPPPSPQVKGMESFLGEFLANFSTVGS